MEETKPNSKPISELPLMIRDRLPNMRVLESYEVLLRAFELSPRTLKQIKKDYTKCLREVIRLIYLIPHLKDNDEIQALKLKLKNKVEVLNKEIKQFETESFRGLPLFDDKISWKDRLRQIINQQL